MFFKCSDDFVLRTDQIHYITAGKDGICEVHLKFTKDYTYSISVLDYTSLVAKLLKQNTGFYMTSNGDVFNIYDIMCMSKDDLTGKHYVYIFDADGKESDIDFEISKENLEEILNLV